MRGLFFAALFLTMITSTAFAADAAPKISNDTSWKEYRKFLEGYYFLDKQKAGHISCRVSDPKLSSAIKALRQKDYDIATIDETLHDFSVTYDHTTGVSFNTPHIKISLLPDVKFTDHEQADNWQKKGDKLFNEEVNYVEKIITELLHTELTSPSPEKQRNLSLTKNSEVTVVSFNDSNNYHVKNIFSGTTREQTTMPIFNVTSKSDYQTLNGRLALTHVTAVKTLGSTRSNASLSVSYQDLGSVFFPAQLLNDVTTSDDTQNVKSQHYEIDFTDCKTSDVSP